MILQADYIVTGDGRTVLENGAVMVSATSIRMVGTREAVHAAFPDEPTVTYDGSTLMPGMIDLHEHIALFDNVPNREALFHSPALRALFAAKRMRDTLQAGVTTIRDVSSADYIGVALIEAGKAGYMDVPRIFTCGKGLCITGGHGYDLFGACKEVDGENEVRKAVRTNLREGANCIKILTSESYRGVEMNQEEINAAVEEAHRFGVRIAAHTGYGDSLQMCIDAGCDTIEHGTHLSREQCLQMKAHNQTWVPTIFVFRQCLDLLAGAENSRRAYFEDSCACYQEHFKELYDTGVRVACGTDTDCIDYPEAAPVSLECAIMVRYGLTPLQAIECATKNGAEALGIGDSVGLLQEGYMADIIAVSGKPFEDIGALRNVTAVYTEGRQVVG